MSSPVALTEILDHADVDRLITLALDEDGIHNDLTTRAAVHGMNPEQARATTRATVVAKTACVAAGFPLVPRILSISGFQNSVRATALCDEGHRLTPNSPWIIFEGNGADLLRVERTILNFLMRMSGIATETSRAVALLAGTSCQLLHSRKTVPGHRRTDIYSALAGGARPHRRSLSAAILVKENHLRLAPSFQTLADGIEIERKQAAFVEIEVTDFTELKHALAAKPDRIMLDNFSVENVKRAVELFGGSVALEASGGINLKTIADYAQTGVDYVSMGWITHSSPAADLSLLFDFK